MKISSLLVAISIISTLSHAFADEYKVNIGDFRNLKVFDNVNVIYHCSRDSAGYAVFAGKPEFADAFIFENNNKGTLRVNVSTEAVGAPDLPSLILYSNFLSSIENSSDFHIKVINPAPCAEFKAQVVGNGSISVYGLDCSVVKAKINTGNGSIALSGKTDEAAYSIIGTGVIQADNVESKTVRCNIFGTGSIGCFATETLKVRGIGSTKIYYKGNPIVKKSGGGRLIPLEYAQPENVVTKDDL